MRETEASSPSSPATVSGTRPLHRPGGGERQKFHVQLIKPSHYDDDGYVIQWVRAFIPSNSLACVMALVEEVRDQRGLGDDVEVVVDAYDECNVVVPTGKIIRRIRDGGGKGVVLLVGVQSNQFPRATDIARPFRAAGIPVAIGGFHVSGCIAMLPEMPDDMKRAQELGITFFAGEAEGRMDRFLADAYHDRLQPIYDHMDDLPDLQDATPPFLPRELANRYMLYTAFDAGRGCPFKCSFCTIINVQGRVSRWRAADNVEKLVRANYAQGVNRFFITDDNFARNRNWEPIFDRLIEMRRREGIRVKFILQVDTACHKVPGFIEKARRAGCHKVFIGLENVNPDNLQDAGKPQNKISEYRSMLQAWRAQGVVTYAGYILGFPGDTPESIERDIRILQRELPVEIMEFFLLTPLPGSADHQRLDREGVWMDPDMNKYDLEHVTTRHHAHMTPERMQDIYERSWHLYYTPEHIETMLRRAEVTGAGARRVGNMIWEFYGSFCIEKLHPLQSGLFRRKKRRLRRPELRRESPLIFYPRRLWEILVTNVRIVAMIRRIRKIRERVQNDPARLDYMDLAIQPVRQKVEEELEMFQIDGAARRSRAAGA